MDMLDIQGQQHIRRALEVAAAGRHSLCISGAAATGKTWLAAMLTTLQDYSRVTSLLPYPVEPEEVQALLQVQDSLLCIEDVPLHTPDTRSILATSTSAAHLVCTADMCSCGLTGNTRADCTCYTQQVQAYQKRWLDAVAPHVDLYIETDAQYRESSRRSSAYDASSYVRNRVEIAQAIQYERQGYLNGALTTREAIEAYCLCTQWGTRLLNLATEQLALSELQRIIVMRLARTSADLSGDSQIDSHHIAEALQYRLENRV